MNVYGRLVSLSNHWDIIYRKVCVIKKNKGISPSRNFCNVKNSGRGYSFVFYNRYLIFQRLVKKAGQMNLTSHIQ